MYDRAELDLVLSEHGYQRLEETRNWAEIVRQKYLAEVQKSDLPVMDVRCPKIKELLNEAKDNKVTVPEINPILLHCGAECREMVENGEIFITTPCQALADMGNALKLKNTVFIPWNQFAKKLGLTISQRNLDKSPIPPGFFDSLPIKTSSISGENEIRCYLKQGIPEDVKLVEMLYCKDGCHNGDGIRTEHK